MPTGRLRRCVEKDGGGTTGGGTYRCTALLTPEQCKAKEFDELQGYWVYDAAASTVGGPTKTNTPTHMTESSSSQELMEKLSVAIKEGFDMRMYDGEGGNMEYTDSMSVTNKDEWSQAVSDETTSTTIVGGDCPRSVWRWVFAGVHKDHPECNVQVRPGEYTAYTNAPTDRPCCLPEKSICDTNEHNPCANDGFLCKGLFDNNRNSCTETCRSLGRCKDTKRGACPT